MKAPKGAEILKKPAHHFAEGIKSKSLLSRMYQDKENKTASIFNMKHLAQKTEAAQSLRRIENSVQTKAFKTQNPALHNSANAGERKLMESRSVDNINEFHSPSYFKSLSKTLKELSNKTLHGQKGNENLVDVYLNKIHSANHDCLGFTNLKSVFAQSLLDYEKNKNQRIKAIQNDISHVQKKPDLVTKHLVSRKKLNIQNLATSMPLIFTEMASKKDFAGFNNWRELISELETLDKRLSLEETMSEEMPFPRVKRSKFDELACKIAKKMESLPSFVKTKESLKNSMHAEHNIFMTQQKEKEYEMLHKLKNIGNNAINSINYLQSFGKLSKSNIEFVRKKLSSIADQIMSEANKHFGNNGVALFTFCLKSAESLHNLGALSLKALMKELGTSAEAYGNAVLNSALLSTMVMELTLNIIDKLLDHSNSLFKSNEQAKIAQLETQTAIQEQKIRDLETQLVRFKASEVDLLEEIRHSNNKNIFFEKALKKMKQQMENKSELVKLLAQEHDAVTGFINDSMQIAENLKPEAVVENTKEITKFKKKLRSLAEISGEVDKLAQKITEANIQKNKSKFNKKKRANDKIAKLKKNCTTDVAKMPSKEQLNSNFYSMMNIERVQGNNSVLNRSGSAKVETNQFLGDGANVKGNTVSDNLSQALSNHKGLGNNMDRGVSITISKQSLTSDKNEQNSKTRLRRGNSLNGEAFTNTARSGLYHKELLLDSISDDDEFDEENESSIYSSDQDDVDSQGLYLFQSPTFLKKYFEFKNHLTYERYIDIKSILNVKEMGIQVNTQDQSNHSSVSDLNVQTFKINIIDSQNSVKVVEKPRIHRDNQLYVEKNNDLNHSIALSMYNLDPNASPESLNIIEKCTKIDEILGQIENRATSMTVLDSENIAAKIEEFFNDLESNIKDPTVPAKNEFVYQMLAFKLEKLEKVITNNIVSDQNSIHHNGQEVENVLNETNSMDPGSVVHSRRMSMMGMNSPSPRKSRLSQSGNKDIRRMSLVRANQNSNKLFTTFNARYQQIKHIIDAKLGDNIGTDKKSLDSLQSDGNLNSPWGTKTSKRQVFSNYKIDSKKDKHEILKIAANALEDVLVSIKKSPKNKQKVHAVISPLPKILKQIRFYYEKVLNLKDSNDINLTYIVLKEIAYKTSIKGSGKKFKTLLYNCLEYFDKNDTVRLFSMFLGLKDYVDDESATIYFKVLQKLKEKKIDVFKDDLTLDLRTISEVLTSSLSKYKRTYIRDFMKEVDSVAVKKGNCIVVPLDALMVRFPRAKSRMIENVCEVFYHASDMNDDGDMDFSEFWRLTKYIEPEFFQLNMPNLINIYNEFCTTGKCLTIDGFTQVSAKYNIFKHEAKRRFLASVSERGFVTTMNDLLLYWPRIKNIFLSVNEKVNKEGMTEMIAMLNKILLNFDSNYYEDVWFSYKLLEMEIEEQIVKWKIEQTFICPEFTQFDNILK